jgi:hypothetical protein
MASAGDKAGDRVFVRQPGMREEKLSREETRQLFFADASLIGIVAAVPACRFCWLVNQQFMASFSNSPDDTIHMLADKQGQQTPRRKQLPPQPSLFGTVDTEEPLSAEVAEYTFPVFHYNVPHTSYRHLLYKLRNEAVSLLQGDRYRRYDYLWMVQSAEPAHDTHIIIEMLRQMPEILHVQELQDSDIRQSRDNLLL